MNAFNPAFRVCLLLLVFGTYPASAQVQSYAELRSRAGSSGETVSLVGSQTPRFDGSFRWNSTDPYGQGDDGTLVLDASGPGFWVRQFGHSVTDPVELGWWEGYQNNVNITAWLRSLAVGIGSGSSLHIRASAVAGISVVRCDYINWSGYGIKTFSFLEDSAPLEVKHTQVGNSKMMWDFDNYNRVVVGGNNLNLTFVGNHPGLGLGTAMTESPGLVDFNLSSSYVGAELVDWRANVRDSNAAGLNFTGRQLIGATEGRVNQVNISGEFWNSGTRKNGGIRNLWTDPEAYYVSDPYNTQHGWDGGFAGIVNGVRAGCVDSAFKESRGRGGCGAFFVDHLTGGCTAQYGAVGGAMFMVDRIGNSPSDPYVIKYKDIGASGPTARTGLPEGVHSKKSVDYTLVKHDPLPDTPDGRRFLKFVQLEGDVSNYNGFVSAPIPSPLCEDGGGNVNHTGYANFWRAEASRDGVPSQYRTSYMHVSVERASGGVVNDNWIGGSSYASLQAAGQGADDTPGPSSPDRTWGHTMQIPAGVRAAMTATMNDTSVMTGPGTIERVSVQLRYAEGNNTPITCRDNRIVDVQIADRVVIDGGCLATTIENVTFLRSGASIIQVGAGADVVIDNISAPVGSTITGSGSVVLNGNSVSLPYTINGSEGSGSGSGTGGSTVSRSIPLASGWNIVSLNVAPPAIEVESVFSTVSDDLVVVKDGLGNVYYPSFNINTIGTWSALSGYQVNLGSSATLQVEGAQIDPSGSSIPLSPGWNLIPYYPTQSRDVDVALTSISSKLVMVKDNEGRLYYPELGINTLSQMSPGQGYLVYVTSSTSLLYQ